VIEKPFRAHLLLRLIDDALLTVARNRDVVPLGAVADPERSRVPVGLEWVGGRPVV
jgi:hypothetical protein